MFPFFEAFPFAHCRQLPDLFKDFASKYTSSKKLKAELLSHCRQECIHAQWRIILDEEFLDAYEHGIVIECCDGITCRFYPRKFTYTADYPEKYSLSFSHLLPTDDPSCQQGPAGMYPKPRWLSMPALHDSTLRCPFSGDKQGSG